MVTDAPVLDDETREEVEYLKAQGEHAAAASALWAVGFPRDAGRIFEEIFEHENALAAYEDADDVVGAMRMALVLENQAAVDRVVTRALRSGKAEALVGALRQGKRLTEVGRIHLVSGDLEAAALAFEEGGALLDAAKAREQMGALRAAGVLYERYLDTHVHDAEASFRLGRILCRFSRNDDGVALLQDALRSDDSDERVCQCAPHMVLGFERLGYEAAAETLLTRWQQAAPPEADVPATLSAFLASPYAQSWALPDEDASPTPEPEPEPAGTGLDAFFGDAPASVEPAPVVDTKPAVDDGDDAQDEALLAGRYLLGEPLGGGGVGQVFRAFDAFMEQAVALKIFGKQALASDAIQAYAREARAAASLGHPAVTPLVELNLAHGFQATDLVAGETVEHRLQQGGDGAWLRPMTASLLELLSSCHRVGLIHGALKPTNLFLIPGGLRVVDFGAHHLLSLRSTETGGLSSSWPYLAPEQLFGAPADVHTDLYALAAVLYRALTGHPPFSNAEADRRTAPPPASSRNEAVDAAWDAFFDKALAPKAADRFAHAADFADALPPFSFAALPKAQLPEGKSTPAPVLLDEEGRYEQGALVFRTGDNVRVYEGEDKALERQVWLVEANDKAELAPLVACAKAGNGVQPVYDVQRDGCRVIVARDSTRKRRSKEALRQMPQTLSRDFEQLATSLARLHEEGFALGGFDFKRAVGPTGPRMRVAPAPLPVVGDEGACQADWLAFGVVLLQAFGDDGVDAAAAETTTSTLKERFVYHLEQGAFLQRPDVDALRSALEANAPWPQLLAAITEKLVQRAPVRVITRLIASVVDDPTPAAGDAAQTP